MAIVIPFTAASRRRPPFIDNADRDFGPIEQFVDFPSIGPAADELNNKLERLAKSVRWAFATLGEGKSDSIEIVREIDHNDPRHTNDVLRDMLAARDFVRAMRPIIEMAANRLGIAMACAMDPACCSSRRALLAGTAAPAATTLPSDMTEDPIFALIAEHRAAIRAFLKAVSVSSALPAGPEFNAAEAMTHAVSDRSHDLLGQLLHAEPTTLEGVAGLLHHLGCVEFLDEEELSAESRESLLTSANETENLKHAGQDFPIHLARIIRRLISTT